MEAGVPPKSKPFQFIGYAQLRAHLGGVVTLEEAVKSIRQATRRYAKRQLTWFRKEPNVQWFEGFGDDLAVRESVFAFLQNMLKPL
jgi:tRNA dimethylallyltransferase